MKKSSKIYYIITIVMGIILVPILGSIIPVSINHPGEYPLSFVIAFSTLAPCCLVISIVALIRKTGVWQTVLLKAAVVCFLLGISSIEWGIASFITFGIIAAVLFRLYFAMRRCKTPTQRKKDEDKFFEDYFRYKGEWAWDAACAEYLKKTGYYMDKLTDEDNDAIYRYTMMPVAYYFYWLVMKGLLRDEFYEEMDLSTTDNRFDVLDILEQIDFYIGPDELTKTALDFSKYYAQDMYCTLYSHKLTFDYWEEIKNPDRFWYCVDFSWEVCERMCRRIDETYENWEWNPEKLSDEKVNAGEFYDDDKWNMDLEDPNIYKRAYSKRFGDLNIYKIRGEKKILDNITDEYIESCLKDLDEIDDYQFARLDRWVANEYGDSLLGEFFKEFKAVNVDICEPHGDGDLVYIVSGEAQFEPEHGFAFYVRNSVIFDFGYGYGFNDIYSPENVRDYETAKNTAGFENITSRRMADEMAQQGKLIRLYLQPLHLGGTADESNCVYLTPAAVKEKEFLDGRLEALMAEHGGRLKFTYRAVYYDSVAEKHPVPMRIAVWHDVRPAECVFSFWINVWN